MNRNTWIFIIVTVLLLGAAFLFINWSSISGKKKDKTDPGDGGNVGIPGGGSSSGLDTSLIMSNGVYNRPEVGVLQKMLNKIQPSNQLTVDEDFGPLTEYKLYSVTGKKSITLADMYALYPAYK